MKKRKILALIIVAFLMLFVTDVKAADHGGGGEKVEVKGSSCLSYEIKTDCETNPDFACIWNGPEKGGYCNTDNLTYVSCGSAFDIPSRVPSLISFTVNLLKIATPIILILVSVITLVKALAASKEDEIKKAQSSLVKKLIAGALVFFVITIVQFVVSLVADDAEANDISTCLKCFLNNDCEGNSYYKTNIAGTYVCTDLKTKTTIPCADQSSTDTTETHTSSSGAEHGGSGGNF